MNIKEVVNLARILALIIIVTPGVIAALGIKLMRDALFYEIYPFLMSAGIQFVVGLILFIAGLAFIGGFLYRRDQRRNLINNYKKDKQGES